MQIINFLVNAISFCLFLFAMHLLFAKQGNRLLNRLLAFALLSRFSQIIVYVPITSFQLSLYPTFYKIVTPLIYAGPACFYLYLIGLINIRNSLQRIEWLHFIPVILAIIHVLPWNFPFEINLNMLTEKIAEKEFFYSENKAGLFTTYFHSLFRPVLMMGYLVASWYAYLTLPLDLKNKLSDVTKAWISFFLKCATIFQLITVFQLINLFHPFFKNMEQGGLSSLWFVILTCLALLSFIIFIVHHPRILYGYLLVAVNWKKNLLDSKVSFFNMPLSKSNIMPDELEVYKEVIIKFMANERPFLLHGFQIIHLAQKLDIPVHQCSFIINNRMDKNFRDWINMHRIVHFISQYPIKRHKMTIESIAHESGFKNNTTFYNAFKKETGLMPTAYFSNKK